MGKVLSVRVEVGEHQALAARARATGVSLSEYCRLTLAGAPLPPPAVARLDWQKLAPTCANLNQIAHQLNAAALSGGEALIAIAAREAAAVLQQVAALRETLFPSRHAGETE